MDSNKTLGYALVFGGLAAAAYGMSMEEPYNYNLIPVGPGQTYGGWTNTSGGPTFVDQFGSVINSVGDVIHTIQDLAPGNYTQEENESGQPGVFGK